jgi:hypothetical protein
VVELVGNGGKTSFHVAKTFPIGELGETHGQELVPIGGAPWDMNPKSWTPGICED